MLTPNHFKNSMKPMQLVFTNYLNCLSSYHQGKSIVLSSITKCINVIINEQQAECFVADEI